MWPRAESRATWGKDGDPVQMSMGRARVSSAEVWHGCSRRPSVCFANASFGPQHSREADLIIPFYP